MRRGRFFLAFFPAFLVVSGAFAENFSFSADRVESVLATGKERTVLEGRARVRSGTLSINADRIEISGKNNSILVCSGSVEAVDEERGIRLESPRLRYDRPRKLALMEGPSALEDRKNRVVLKANWIQNDGTEELTIAQVNVRILKEGLACRAEYALYRRSEDYLELSGAPRAWKNGDEYRASRMVVNTKTEEIKLEGAVSGSVSGGGEDEESAPPATPGENAPAPPPEALSPQVPSPSSEGDPEGVSP